LKNATTAFFNRQLVSGESSTWTSSGYIYFGGDPPADNSTASLTVTEGGKVTAVSGVYLLHGATLSGNGTIEGTVNNNGGTVAPGTSPGVLSVIGNYNQNTAGVLNMEIGGPTLGLQYDQLSVTGAATSTAR